MSGSNATIRGIQNSLSGVTIESENISDKDIAEQVADQEGHIEEEITYDNLKELRITVHAKIAPSSYKAGGTITYASKTWRIDTVEEAGTYNGVKRWNITAHIYTKPTAST